MSVATSVLTKEAEGYLSTAKQCGHRDRNEDETAVMATTAAAAEIDEETIIIPSYSTVHRTGSEKGFYRPISGA